MNISDLLTSDMGKQIISGISEKTNVSSNETTSVVTAAIPALLGALQNNASTPDGAAGILGALTSKHDGSILDNLSGFLGGGDTSDGGGILNHILGDKQSALANGISSKTGVSSGNVSQILMMLAPIVMGYLGKQSQGSNVTSGSGLTSLLGGLLGGNSGGSILSSLLDQDGDGQVGLSDLAGLASGNKKDGLGGLLGKLFGK